MQVVFNAFSAGDVKPLAISVRPDDLNGHTPGVVVSGSWHLVNAVTGDPIENGITPLAGSLSVDARPGPSMITTADITWLASGTYVCRFSLLWNDGEVDNTLSARVTVNPAAT